MNRCLSAEEQTFVRMWRDVQATFMPMSDMAARKLIGASKLGFETAPSIGFHETDHSSRAKSTV